MDEDRYLEQAAGTRLSTTKAAITLFSTYASLSNYSNVEHTTTGDSPLPSFAMISPCLQSRIYFIVISGTQNAYDDTGRAEDYFQ